MKVLGILRFYQRSSSGGFEMQLLGVQGSSSGGFETKLLGILRF